MRARRVCGIAAMLSAVAVQASGCGGGSSKVDQTTTQTRSTPTTTTEVDATYPGVPSAPVDVVKELWLQLRAGGVPSAATLYDPRVAKRLGRDRLAGALKTVAPQFNTTRPIIDSVKRTDVGVLVLVHRKDPKRPATFSSYLLAKPAGAERWQIRYDSLLSDALFSFVRTLTQNRINPKAKEPSPTANAVAQRAQQRYVSAFSPGPTTPTG